MILLNGLDYFETVTPPENVDAGASCAFFPGTSCSGYIHDRGAMQFGSCENCGLLKSLQNQQPTIIKTQLFHNYIKNANLSNRAVKMVWLQRRVATR